MPPLRIEINGNAIAATALPSACVVVYPQPSDVTLTGAPLTSGWPTAYLTWDVAATQAALAAWRGMVGRVDDLMLPDPYGSTGTITRSSVDYFGHSLFTYGVVIAPRFTGSARAISATVNGTGAMVIRGAVVVEIRDLGRFASWP